MSFEVCLCVFVREGERARESVLMICSTQVSPAAMRNIETRARERFPKACSASRSKNDTPIIAYRDVTWCAGVCGSL
jgi:hypothetical protein